MVTSAVTLQAIYTTLSDMDAKLNAILQQIANKIILDPTTPLNNLAISTVLVQRGIGWQALILNRTYGSTITATSSDGTLMTVVGSTVSGVFTTNGAPVLTFTEALAGGTPKVSTVTLAVVDPGGIVTPPTLGTLTLSSLAATAGMAWSTTITGKTAGSTISATSSDGTSLTVSGATISGTFSAAGTPTITITETLAGATNTPKSSVFVVTVAAAGTTFNGSFDLGDITTPQIPFAAIF